MSRCGTVPGPEEVHGANWGDVIHGVRVQDSHQNLKPVRIEGSITGFRDLHTKDVFAFNGEWV